MRKSYVKAGEDYLPSDSKKIEFLNIEEDWAGRDIMTFAYNGKVHKSYVFIGKPA